MVVIGVGGELITHVFSSRANQTLVRLQSDEERDLQGRVAEANKAAAGANEHAKQLEKQTEELRSQNLELQRRISPRFLTTAESEIILDALKAFPGHRASIMRLGDAEAAPCADSFIGLFQQAGWILQVNVAAYYAPPTYGIVCRVAPKPDETVKTILAAFKKAKLDVKIEQVPAQQDSWLDIFVGLKPPN